MSSVFVHGKTKNVFGIFTSKENTDLSMSYTV